MLDDQDIMLFKHFYDALLSLDVGINFVQDTVTKKQLTWAFYDNSSNFDIPKKERYRTLVARTIRRARYSKPEPAICPIIILSGTQIISFLKKSTELTFLSRRRE